MATKLKPVIKRITTEEAEQIAVNITKENKDGSADAVVRFNKQGLQTLVQWGLVAMLAAAIDAYKVRSEKDSKAAIKRVRPITKKASKK